MLIHVHDWHAIAGTDALEVPCPICQRRTLIARSDLDRDACVFLRYCGHATVRLSGYELLSPRPVAHGSA